MAKIVHSLIASTAKEITAEAWEILSSDDKFHRMWPKVGPFVRRQWKNFVGHARASLVVMLTKPDVSDFLKQEVYEALCLEGGFKAHPSAFERSPLDLGRSTLH